MNYQNVTSFINAIHQTPAPPGSTRFYRGHCNSDFNLTPSIYRDGYIKNEDVIFKEAILRTPNEFEKLRTTFEKLVKMQHYGIPTRLLDITTNPLVALYFACANSTNSNGEVLCFNVPNERVKFYDSDTVSCLSNISRRPNNFSFEEVESIQTFNDQHHIGYLLHEIKDEKPYFQNLINPLDMKSVFAIKAKLDNPRILKQNGAFFLFGVNCLKERMAEIPDSWLGFRGPERLIIPKDKKETILDNLDAIAVNESSLFPELENQALYIKKRYKNV